MNTPLPELTLSQDVLMHFLIFISAFISMIAGVGGGALYTPLLMLVCSYSIYQAIPISITIIFFTSIVNVCFFLTKKRENKPHRALINFPALLAVIPFLANSSFVGTYLIIWMPKLITLLCIILILGGTVYKNVIKCISLYKQENIDKKLKQNMTIELENVIDIQHTEQNKTGETKKTMIVSMILIFVPILILCSFSVLRSTIVTKCSTMFIVIIMVQLVICGIIGILIYLFLKRDIQIKNKNNYDFLAGDIIWTTKIFAGFAFAGTIIGIFGTYIGIGGAMLFNPILLSLNVPPDVVVASSSLLACTSSLSAMINYGSAGQIPWTTSLTLSACGIIGTICGIFMFNIIVDRLKRKSILVFTLIFITVSGIVLLSTNIIKSDALSNFEIGDICIN